MKVLCDYCGVEYARLYDPMGDVFLLEHPLNLCEHSGKRHQEKISTLDPVKPKCPIVQ